LNQGGVYAFIPKLASSQKNSANGGQAIIKNDKIFTTKKVILCFISRPPGGLLRNEGVFAKREKYISIFSLALGAENALLQHENQCDQLPVDLVGYKIIT